MRAATSAAPHALSSAAVSAANTRTLCGCRSASGVPVAAVAGGRGVVAASGGGGAGGVVCVCVGVVCGRTSLIANSLEAVGHSRRTRSMRHCERE